MALASQNPGFDPYQAYFNQKEEQREYKRRDVKHLVNTGLEEIREMQEAIDALDGGHPKKSPKKDAKKQESTVHSLLKQEKDSDGDDDDVRAAKSNRFYDHEKAF